jgi:integrase
MARAIHKLSDVKVKTPSLKAGRHSDGGGLYLSVATAGTKSWVFMWTPPGAKKRKEMGLGSYPTVSLQKARARAVGCREAVADGKDPIAERDRKQAPTFGQAAEAYFKAHQSAFRNSKHLYQWQMTLSIQREPKSGEYVETGYCRTLRPILVDKVTTEDVLTVLKPIWEAIPETASRLRARIERVLDAERALGHRQGENPARWRGHLDSLLGKRKKLYRGHHAAMPFADVPAFMAELREREAMAARALEFTILAAARSGESLGARWAEFDFDKKIWHVPADRMKSGRSHDVPLTDRQLEILADLRAAPVSDYVFPSTDRTKPLSSMAMLMLLRRMGRDKLTAHGFRSSFRDWAGDNTSFSREVAEAALAHKVGDGVEQAYRRGTALEKRRKLMEAWDCYCQSAKVPARGNVVPLTRQVK